MSDNTQDYADDLLQHFPGPLALQRSRAKWIGLLLIFIAFTAGGVWMVASGDWRGWLGLVFFGLGILISVLNLLPGASALTLDKNGFKASSMFRGHETAWRDASGFTEFKLGPLGAATMVVYDDAKAKGRAVAGANVALSGRNSGLPDTYGLSAAELVTLMTRWRERAEQHRVS
jgi:hypothetical protein